MVNPPPPPGPRPAAPSGPARTNPRKPEGGRTITIPASASSQSGEPHQSRDGHPFARRKEQHHTLSGNEHVTVTLLLTSDSNHRQQPYHTSVERTAPNKNTQEDGKATRPNKTTTHLTGKRGGYHGVGFAAALHHIYMRIESDRKIMIAILKSSYGK